MVQLPAREVDLIRMTWAWALIRCGTILASSPAPFVAFVHEPSQRPDRFSTPNATYILAMSWPCDDSGSGTLHSWDW